MADMPEMSDTSASSSPARARLARWWQAVRDWWDDALATLTPGQQTTIVAALTLAVVLVAYGQPRHDRSGAASDGLVSAPGTANSTINVVDRTTTSTTTPLASPPTTLSPPVPVVGAPTPDPPVTVPAASTAPKPSTTSTTAAPAPPPSSSTTTSVVPLPLPIPPIL